MIENFTDHAANERTYLAWVRTALAFMAFGLVLERFDLVFHALAAPETAGAGPAMSGLARTAGSVLIGLGVVVLGVSSFRYLRFKQLIAAGESRDFRSSRTDLVLVVIVALIGLAMTVYVASQALDGGSGLR